MTAPNFTVQTGMLAVTWTDDTTTQFPTIWLRDNCPPGLHPETHERLLDLLAIDETPVLISATLDGGFAVLEHDDGHVSRMPLAWLNMQSRFACARRCGDILGHE